jgi:CubicO group peptidase (beta-lactamase class C family)
MARGILRKFTFCAIARSRISVDMTEATGTPAPFSLPSVVVESKAFGGNSVFRSGAPRPMKMGTIASPSPYDAASRDALQSANLRRPAILHYAGWAPDFPISQVVRLSFDSGYANESAGSARLGRRHSLEVSIGLSFNLQKASRDRMSAEQPSRRKTVAALAATVGCALVDRSFASAQPAGPAENCIMPISSATGPNAELYGAGEGYPLPDIMEARKRGNPWELKYRVGAFSHLDQIYPTRLIERAVEPWKFKCSTAEIYYNFQERRFSLLDYMSRNPVTGLLIARDDKILFESYQYSRTDRDRFVSQSMVKSIMGLLIGIAASEGAIKSVDDAPEAYVPGFRGTEYGRTPIRDLLRMSSGVDFGENRDGGRDLNRLWNGMGVAFPTTKIGTIESIVQFNRRVAAAGTRFYYASIEPDVLGIVLHSAVKKSASDYLREKVWEPIGAEADARWLVDAEGFELAHFGFNAVLRDYARLGRLLAHDGAWEGKQIVPAQWMIDATTIRASDAYLLPGRATKKFGYGYLLWLFPGEKRQFALIGYKGQYICIDPSSKLVMVQTAVEAPDFRDNDEAWALWSAVVDQLG